jgi:hypothetical protein
MSTRAVNPFTYTHVEAPVEGALRQAEVTTVRNEGRLDITFRNDPYANEWTGGHFEGGSYRPDPVNGSGAVDLANPSVAIVWPFFDQLSLPWRAAIRVREQTVDYGINTSKGARANNLSVGVAASVNPYSAWGWAPFDHAYQKLSHAATGFDDPDVYETTWTYDGTTGGPFAAPYWIMSGSMTGRSSYIGIHFGDAPPHINEYPSLTLGGFDMPDGPGKVAQGIAHIQYGMGGYNGGDPHIAFGQFPTYDQYVQPGGATISIDAFIFEGGIEWPADWETIPDVGTSKASWGMIAS